MSKTPSQHHSLPKAVGTTAPLHAAAAQSSLSAAQHHKNQTGGPPRSPSIGAGPSEGGLPPAPDVDVAAVVGTFTDRHSANLYSRQVTSLNKLLRAKVGGLVRRVNELWLCICVCTFVYAHIFDSHLDHCVFALIPYDPTYLLLILSVWWLLVQKICEVTHSVTLLGLCIERLNSGRVEFLEGTLKLIRLHGIEFQKDEAFELLQSGDVLVRLCSLLGDCLQSQSLSLVLAATQTISAFLAWGRLPKPPAPGDTEVDTVPPLQSLTQPPFNDRITVLALIPTSLMAATHTLLALPPVPLSMEASAPFTATFTAKAAKAASLHDPTPLAAKEASNEVPTENTTVVLEAVQRTVRDVALSAVGAKELLRVGVAEVLPPFLAQSYTVSQVFTLLVCLCSCSCSCLC
jgi:hypothetical protein